MKNVNGEPYSCADCEFQDLDWDRMRAHIRKKHNREPHCGPDAMVTPDNVYVGAILLNHETGERVRITEIVDRTTLKLRLEPLSPIERNLFRWTDGKWLFG